MGRLVGDSDRRVIVDMYHVHKQMQMDKADAADEAPFKSIWRVWGRSRGTQQSRLQPRNRMFGGGTDCDVILAVHRCYL